MNKLLLSFLTSVTLISSSAFAMDPEDRGIVSLGQQKSLKQQKIEEAVLEHVRKKIDLDKAKNSTYHPGIGMQEQEIFRQNMSTKIQAIENTLNLLMKACVKDLEKHWDNMGNKIYQIIPLIDSEDEEMYQGIINDALKQGDLLDLMRIEGGNLYVPARRMQENKHVKIFLDTMLDLEDRKKAMGKIIEIQLPELTLDDYMSSICLGQNPFEDKWEMDNANHNRFGIALQGVNMKDCEFKGTLLTEGNKKIACYYLTKNNIEQSREIQEPLRFILKEDQEEIKEAPVATTPEISLKKVSQGNGYLAPENEQMKTIKALIVQPKIIEAYFYYKNILASDEEIVKFILESQGHNWGKLTGDEQKWVITQFKSFK